MYYAYKCWSCGKLVESQDATVVIVRKSMVNPLQTDEYYCQECFKELSKDNSNETVEGEA